MIVKNLLASVVLVIYPRIINAITSNREIIPVIFKTLLCLCLIHRMIAIGRAINDVTLKISAKNNSIMDVSSDG